MPRTSYALALGSNRPGRVGPPRAVIDAAVRALAANGLAVTGRSRTISTPAMGGPGRGFANAAVLVDSDAPPDALLMQLKRIERDFGRRPGRRWGPRVLDLDIALWSGGAFAGAKLVVPHAALTARDFVLAPLAQIAPDWRHPRLGLTVRQLRARLRRAKPVDRSERRP